MNDESTNNLIELVLVEPTPLFRLFVYGTLKRGYWNHDRFCRNAVSMQKATVRGRLYQFQSGIPILEVPEEDILAFGTSDYTGDMYLADSSLYIAQETALMYIHGTWLDIEGELITFNDLDVNIPPIDRLEGYIPGQPERSMYKRVLVPVNIGDEVSTAWCYVVTGIYNKDMVEISDNKWG